MSDSNMTQSLGIVTRSGLVLKPYVKPSKSSSKSSPSQKPSLGTQDAKEDVPPQIPQSLELPQSAYVETEEEKEWRLYQEEEEWWAQYEWKCKKELSAMGI